MKSKVQSPKSKVIGPLHSDRFNVLTVQRFNANPRHSPQAAFTMIEIAICLAVIGFALVAIIGVLPIGMNVQKDNRQETIINQDASVIIDAIRNGARGLDDLTNYVTAITDDSYVYRASGAPVHQVWVYTSTSSTLNGAATTPPFPIINGARIVGLLSTPKYSDLVFNAGAITGFTSNHIVATVRSMSGPASEKFPQTNSTIADLALSYKLISEVTPYGTNFYDPSWTNYSVQFTGGDTNLAFARSNYMRLVQQYAINLHDLRLTFRWPLLPNGNTGPGRQIYRTMVSGYMVQTNDNFYGPSNLFFFQPRYYVKAPRDLRFTIYDLRGMPAGASAGPILIHQSINLLIQSLTIRTD